MKMKFKIILVYVLLINLSVIAEDRDIFKYEPSTFDIIKYKGNIGKYPITMILTFYPDNRISGYYYYDNIGRLIKIEKLKDQNSFVFQAKQIEEFEDNDNSANPEVFEFPDNLLTNKNFVKAQWSYKQKTYPVNLMRDTSMFDWRLLRLKSIGYFKDSYFKTQTTDFSIIYPSISSSSVLNKSILVNIIKDKQMIAFINSLKSKYLLIDQNFGEKTSDIEDCCWSQDGSDELAYISDSILTFRSHSFTYANNGYETESYISLKVSNGEHLTTQNIFKINSDR